MGAGRGREGEGTGKMAEINICHDLAPSGSLLRPGSNDSAAKSSTRRLVPQAVYGTGPRAWPAHAREVMERCPGSPIYPRAVFTPQSGMRTQSQSADSPEVEEAHRDGDLARPERS